MYRVLLCPLAASALVATPARAQPFWPSSPAATQAFPPHTRVSSGCIRMRNEDVIDLYDRGRVGARVVVI
jgi:hypothetical protein